MNLRGENDYEYSRQNFTGAVTAVESGCHYAAGGDRISYLQSASPLGYDPLYRRELMPVITRFGLDLSPESLWERGRELVIATVRKSVDVKIGIAPYLKALSPLDLLNYFNYCVKHNLNPLSDLVGMGFDPESLRLYPQISHQGYLQISRIEPGVSDVRFNFSGTRRAVFSYTKEIFDPASGVKQKREVKAERDYFLSCTCSFKRGDKAYSATAFFDELYIPDCEPWATRPKELLSQKAFDRTVAIAYELVAEEGKTEETIGKLSGAGVTEDPLTLNMRVAADHDADWQIAVAGTVPVEELNYEDLSAAIKEQTLSLGVDLILDKLKQPLLQLSDYEQTRLICLASKRKLDLMAREGVVPAVNTDEI